MYRSISVIQAMIFMIYVLSKSQTKKIDHKIGQGAVKRSLHHFSQMFIDHNVEIKIYLEFFLILVPPNQL